MFELIYTVMRAVDARCVLLKGSVDLENSAEPADRADGQGKRSTR